MRIPCSHTQSLPTCTGSTAADSASMNPISSGVIPSVSTGASRISGTTISRPSASLSQLRANSSPPAAISDANTSATAAGTQW